MDFAMFPKQEDADAEAVRLLLKREEEALAENLYRIHFKSEDRAAAYDYGPPIPVEEKKP